ncbi:MAG: L-aspartate oxidase [Gammaproteobacteria bacterium]|jgi:L-aspartate oxidase|nr:L-aspartate oxidase [Gammaproteobacteria bacterium]MBT4605950.1 L-aspartate oxidase [Thiotrichales bacterium]MBT3471351.1 L-aspartate oxidase [Gammaproteobacteria bacterium]MBT3966799.1 L-aspartate oxidase [Gammaproteobacteria bacterium]MBT4080611.1 L-aspartate oxidase [Gammaproteobacteria bacterium]
MTLQKHVTFFPYDVLVIGSGAAGLTTALQLDPALRVALLSKSTLDEGSTLYAQGGIAAVLDEADSIDSHVNDTLNAGDGLCDESVVRFAVERARGAIEQLVEAGVPFSRTDSSNPEAPFHLTREGGHSNRRVIHSADATGKAVESTLTEQVRQRENIDIFEHHIAIDLITQPKQHDHGEPHRVVGAYVLNRPQQQVRVFQASRVVLATGGASKVYLYTSNPDISTGDGIAMAWRAGCRVANMEFNQFHPTCLYHPKAKSFLVTEAVRGEGGKLLLPNLTHFMERFDDRKELAPRDIVARAIDHEMKRIGADHLFLDISFKDPAFIREHFPMVYNRLQQFGIDMTSDPIPVVPAAHYTCGGIITDLEGKTDLEGLYAVGEVAHTGLHGANRMASNSLLECLVFAAASANAINQNNPPSVPTDPIPAWDESRVTDSDEEVVVSHNWDELRRFMWDYVGIVRTTKRLERAQHRIELLQQEIAEYYSHFRISNNLLELRNLAQVAELIIQSALQRKESRGLHYTLDYPNKQQQAENTILTPNT